MTRLLSVTEVASVLGTSPRFVRRLIAERRITFCKIGRHVRISDDDLQAFVDAGRVPATTGISTGVQGQR
jgi:excisionase family DNA binding protein